MKEKIKIIAIVVLSQMLLAIFLFGGYEIYSLKKEVSQDTAVLKDVTAFLNNVIAQQKAVTK